MTLTTQPLNDDLDLIAGIGQRSESFRFTLVNGLTGGPIGDLNPLRTTGSVSHDTSRTVKRTANLSFGVEDSALINPLTDRVDIFVTVNGVEYPLGRFMFTADTRSRWTSGVLANVTMSDEMFIIDQQIETGINARTRAVTTVITEVLSGFDVTVDIEASDFTSAEVWGPGSRRGQILQSLALSGDFFSPWFGNDQALHFIRAFDPATQVPAFDFDAGNKVARGSIVETNDLLTAPNRFVVVSNASTTPQEIVVGSADIPNSAPHSIVNRGFVIPDVVDLPATTPSQATAMARALALRNSVLEYTNMSTAIDPRHDSYDVIFWNGELWLEVAWSIPLSAGGQMTHSLQRAYS